MASNERHHASTSTRVPSSGRSAAARAEEIVRELVNAGDIQRSQAQEWVDNLVERSRKSSEQILELVRHEVASQLEQASTRSPWRPSPTRWPRSSRSRPRRAASATKDVTAQAGKAAKEATNAAAEAADVTTRAGKTRPTGHKTRAATAKTATTANAATKVAPSAPPGHQDASSPPKAAAKKPHAKKASDTEPPSSARHEGQPADQRGPPPARCRARATRPGRQSRTRRRRPPSPPAIVLVAGTRGGQGGAASSPRTSRSSSSDRPAPFVGRGGHKLDAGTGPRSPSRRSASRHALDAGASTGGFTDCLLQHGARPTSTPSTSATASSHPRLRDDPRVTRRSSGPTCARSPRRRSRPPDPAFEPCSLVTADLSFISLRSGRAGSPGRLGATAPTWSSWSSPSSRRAGPWSARGKGVVRDPEVWLRRARGVTSAPP